MSFDWEEYLVLAKNLVGLTSPPTSEEAKHRSAISRAYYSVFVKARNFLRDIDSDQNLPNDGSIHTYVITQFRSNPSPNRKFVGENLNRLKIQRGKVDYEDNFPGSLAGLKKQTSLLIPKASQITSKLKTLSSGQP